MAGCLKEKPCLLLKFRERLEMLNYPLLGSGDELWIEEILFIPGKNRMCLLNWLLSQFVGQNEGLDDSWSTSLCFMPHYSSERVTSLIWNLGLCKNKCFVMGTAPITEQIIIWEDLLDLAHLMKHYNNEKINEFDNTGDIILSCEAQYKANYDFLKNITRMNYFNALFKKKNAFLPPDVTREAKIAISEEFSESKMPTFSEFFEAFITTNQVFIDEQTSGNMLSNISESPTAELYKKRKTLDNQLHDSSFHLLNLYCSLLNYVNTLNYSTNRVTPVLSCVGSSLENNFLQMEKLNQILTSVSFTTDCYQRCNDLHKLKTSHVKSHYVISGMDLNEATNILDESLPSTSHHIL